MTKMMTLPAASLPAAIADRIRLVLGEHGLAFPDLVDEIVDTTTRALAELDESLVAAAEPSMADRLTVGESLRALAMMGRPNPEVARACDRVGAWLSRTAKAELKLDAETEAA